MGSRLDRADLTDDALTGTFRVWQRAKGHRYSLDDVLTAWEATQGTRPRTHLDLGCGIASVLLMVAYRYEGLSAVGVEAQRQSIELADRNIERNGLRNRVRLVHGDLRDAAVQATLGGPFDLITGTPPYMPPGTSTPSPDPQRRFARIEMRGGVEDYLAAAGRLLAPEGRLVVCCDARTPERVHAGAKAAGLVPIQQRDAVPRAGRSALFSVWTLARSGSFRCLDPFVARDEEGRRTEAYVRVRHDFGLEQRLDPRCESP
ncbi:MAG: methyltransferase [Myxococcota bacterium]